ncbi:transcription intermediary factor 1-alpha isoform X5 [Drosophila subpulchrella]|uniref:transcription intermediary factor 1-alpha isoform X5 n=1 Tax=Drosophila subpulchrella TaxID=1486046 RepID=UPI0018A17856|nr:transcription intermediary factor 1-alpha isoform X5 [Drosophila subpulchrella]
MDMDLEQLKNDFLPLIAGIKQEQLDAVPTDVLPQMSTPSTATTSSLSSSSLSLSNPCDSAEKRSESNSSASAKFTLFKCVYCAQLLGSNDRPKLLECLHVACAQCVSTKFSELDRSLPPLIHCPVCDNASQQEFIVDNQFLIEQCTAGDGGDGVGLMGLTGEGQKTSAATSIQCSSCSDGAVATSWCVDCSEYICDSCVQAHQRLKITKDHTIKPKDEANNEQLAGAAGVDKLHMCQLHTQEKLSLFCETCDKLTCRDCQLSDHRDHKYKFAHEIATESRQALSTLVSEINYKRFLLSSATKVIDDRQQLIHDKKKDLIKEITAMAVKITNTVNTRGKQLIMRLNEVCDSKLKVLVEKKETLQLLSDNTDHCIDFMQNALEKGSDFAILSSKKSLVRHLQKLKCQRADIPNPEIPVRIQVQLNQVSDLQKVISQLGIIIVDGKPYPPTPSPNGTPQPQHPPRQPPSPNMAPPLRPGLPPGMPAGLSPNGPPVNFGPQNGPPLYSNAAQQQFNNLSMSRSFPGDGPVRFGGMPPVGMQRHGQPHVSSSTHPQNMDISLRGLLNNQAAQSPNAHMAFNGPPSYPGGPQGAPAPAHQSMGPQMRPHFMPGQQGFSQGGGPGGGPRDANFMNSNARFQSQYQRMANHAQQQAAAAAAMAGAAGGGGGQIPSPGALQRPPMMSNPMQNVSAMQNSLGFHGSQAGFNAGPPQTSPQLGGGGMHSLAKWHIPQSAQQSNMCSQQGPLLPFANGRQTSENFKISLKSPNTLKNSTPPSLGGGGAGHPGLGNGSSSAQLNAAALGLGPAVSILSNVTSTNPKTPSPSTHENTKDFTEPIDKVRDDSINDLIATIAKLDSNGVQVLPEGRTKTTSPQVHSSTDLSNTQEDDPNEDWCAVCLDGGELMCCDKCPKVFHQNCHIPAISSLPDESESWQCLLCVNLKELTKTEGSEKGSSGELRPLELRILQRICLELYCQYEQSLNFREPESPANTSYYEIVSSPMSLDVIRTRLDPSSPNHYKDIAGFVSDVRLIFSNTYLFYQDTKTYSNAKYLENFFEEQLAKWLPQFEDSKHLGKGSSSNSPALLGVNATGSPSPIENGRKSCGSASLGDSDSGCLPAKRARRSGHE